MSKNHLIIPHNFDAIPTYPKRIQGRFFIDIVDETDSCKLNQLMLMFWPSEKARKHLTINYKKYQCHLFPDEQKTSNIISFVTFLIICCIFYTMEI